MGIKKKIVSCVMALTTMMGMISAMPASANCIYGTDLNLHVLSNNKDSVTIDWNDFTSRDYESFNKMSTRKFSRVEYAIEVTDVTPSTKKDAKRATVSSRSQYTAYDLIKGHTYQFAVNTIYYYTSGKTTKSGYGGTSLVTYKAPTMAETVLDIVPEAKTVDAAKNGFQFNNGKYSSSYVYINKYDLNLDKDPFADNYTWVRSCDWHITCDLGRYKPAVAVSQDHYWYNLCNQSGVTTNDNSLVISLFDPPSTVTTIGYVDVTYGDFSQRRYKLNFVPV